MSRVRFEYPAQVCGIGANLPLQSGPASRSGSIGTVFILLLLQAAIHCDAYLGPVPCALYVLTGAFMALRVYAENSSALKRLAVLCIGLCAVLALNYALSAEIMVDQAQFLRSGANLMVSVLLLCVAHDFIACLQDTSELNIVYAVSLATLVVSFCLGVAEIADLAEVQQSLASGRALLYSDNADFGLFSERSLSVAGFVRPCLLTREPSHLARAMAINMFIVAMLYRPGTGFSRRTAAVLALCVCCGAVTGSPIGLTASLLSVAFVLWAHRGQDLARIAPAMTVSIALCVGAAVWYLQYTTVGQRLGAVMAGQDQSAEVRGAAVAITWDVLDERPFSGVGMGQSELLYEFSNNPALRLTRHQVAVCNALGILFIYLGMTAVVCLWLIHKVCAVRRRWVRPFGYLIMFVFLAFTQGGGVAASFWVPLGLLLALTTGRQLPAPGSEWVE